MDIWAGNLSLPNRDTVAGIHLATTTTATRPAALSLSLPPSPLRFLALVDRGRIPLYVAAGPSLDVWSPEDRTVHWFSALLLDSSHDAATPAQHWWDSASLQAQSPLAILAQVDHDDDAPSHSALRVTELLFYATREREQAQLTLRALPLSADLVSKLPSPPLSPLPQAEEPQFLLPLFDAEEEKSTSELRKRQSVSSLFDAAAQRRKRARRAGGESVAAAAAALPLVNHRRSSSLGATANVINNTAPDHADQTNAPKPSRPLSRSPSLSLAADAHAHALSRPRSRKGGFVDAQGAGAGFGPGKRSSLSRVATADDEDVTKESSLETRNKDTISRLVLAGMRMHGLQQRRKDRARKSSLAGGVGVVGRLGEGNDGLGEAQDAAEAARDAEYKLVYHQTYKGAVFALRRHVGSVPLHAHVDALRETVDRLLGIFCADPLGGGGADEGRPPTGTAAVPHSADTHAPANTITATTAQPPFGSNETPAPAEASPFAASASERRSKSNSKSGGGGGGGDGAGDEDGDGSGLGLDVGVGVEQQMVHTPRIRRVGGRS
ncbi:uncharacterized protein K452DRAFT_302079 [Aplosporella prunicola CBS 121167]|uniref:Sld7 C-terminal domain-containing protein n=1 Tax=Aplosporella prunicola CBS 121167 TaxID=1176127 RepID=A0A6A6B3L8_9PEZI|nr:uncharacterized protein K452DRAFT_302079 [Aplosporella prunicola CBS 121167]KAF2137321.1 hypothetical protein K452DRAFT_302079 [Aplosporella prunicola CBS 121167]